jgi:hypothetical protein
VSLGLASDSVSDREKPVTEPLLSRDAVNGDPSDTAGGQISDLRNEYPELLVLKLLKEALRSADMDRVSRGRWMNSGGMTLSLSLEEGDSKCFNFLASSSCCLPNAAIESVIAATTDETDAAVCPFASE